MTQFSGDNNILCIGIDRGTSQHSTATKTDIQETIASVMGWFKEFLFHK